MCKPAPDTTESLSESRADARVWRLPAFVAWIGVANITYVAIVLLESTQVLPYRLSKPGGFPLDAWGTWLGCTLLVGLGSLLIVARWRFLLTIDDAGLRCRGVFTDRYAPWPNVEEIEIAGRGSWGRAKVNEVGGRTFTIRASNFGGGALQHLATIARQHGRPVVLRGHARQP